MLPFRRHKEGGASSEGEHYDPLQSAAEELILAVHSRNITATANALRAAFEIIDGRSHEEGDHHVSLTIKTK